MPPRIPLAASIRYRPHHFYPSREYSGASSSSTSASYHPKVHALPFTISPTLATEALQTFAATAILHLPTLGQIWRHIESISRISSFRWAETDDIHYNVKQLRAVYVPTWIVSACLATRYVVKGEGELRFRTIGINVPMPGHAVKPLCTIWPQAPSLSVAKAVPFTSHLCQTKWGDAVIPLEYTVSPLRMMGMLKDLPPSAGEFHDIGIAIHPDMSTYDLSLFPILCPFYLAECQQLITSTTATLLLPAYIEDDLSNEPASERPLHLHKYIYRPTNLDDHPQTARYMSWITESKPGIDVAFSLPPSASPPGEPLLQMIYQVLNTCRQDLVRWDTIGGVDDTLWEDRRVVPYTVGEYEKRINNMMQIQQMDILRVRLRRDQPGLSEQEIERKATRVIRYLHKMKAQGISTAGLDFDVLDAKAAAEEESKRKAR